MEGTYQICCEEMQDKNQYYEVHWGSQPDNMILFKGLLRSVLEYGWLCFAEMSDTLIFNSWRGFSGVA
jgi:hypothetical protein